MKAYLSILRIQLATLCQYRAAMIASFGTLIFWGFIKGMILKAFYAESSAMQPITLAEGITFIWLGQTLLQLMPWVIDKEVETKVKTGNIIYELARPLDLYNFWYVRALAMRLVPLFMRSVPLYFLALLFFGLSAPISWQAGIGFCLSVLLAAFLSSSMTTMVIISFFWTVSGEGIQRLLPHTSMLLTGLIVPLPLFPQWLQPFLNIQPFRGLVDIPSRIYTGVIPEQQILFYLLFQIAWIAVFVVGGRALLNRAISRMVIQGG